MNKCVFTKRTLDDFNPTWKVSKVVEWSIGHNSLLGQTCRNEKKYCLRCVFMKCRRRHGTWSICIRMRWINRRTFFARLGFDSINQHADPVKALMHWRCMVVKKSFIYYSSLPLYSQYSPHHHRKPRSQPTNNVHYLDYIEFVRFIDVISLYLALLRM